MTAVVREYVMLARIKIRKLPNAGDNGCGREPVRGKI